MMGLIYFALIGIAAGWICGQIMKTGGGVITHLIVGCIGALVGGFLFSVAGFKAGGLIAELISTTVGAIVLMALLKYIGKK